MNPILKAAKINSGVYTLDRVRRSQDRAERLRETYEGVTVADALAEAAVYGILHETSGSSQDMAYRVPVPEDVPPEAFSYRVGRRALQILTPSLAVVELRTATSCDEFSVKAEQRLSQYQRSNLAGMVFLMEPVDFEWDQDNPTHERLVKRLTEMSQPVAYLPESPSLRALGGRNAAKLQCGLTTQHNRPHLV